MYSFRSARGIRISRSEMPTLWDFWLGNDMAGYSSSLGRSPKPLVPAWVLSIVIHGAMLVALCVAIKPSPHGSPDAQYGSMGLVLHRPSANRDSTGFDQPIIQQTAEIKD